MCAPYCLLDLLTPPQTAVVVTVCARRLPQEAQEGQRLLHPGDHSRGQRVASVANPLLPPSGRDNVHVVGDRVDPSMDCGWHW